MKKSTSAHSARPRLISREWHLLQKSQFPLRLIATTFLLALCPNVRADDPAAAWSLTSADLRVQLAENGVIRALEVKDGNDWEAVKWRDDLLSGPAWGGVPMAPVAGEEHSFAGTANGVRHTIRYRIDGAKLRVIAGLKNEGPEVFAPKAARLVLGIDCEMESFPSWNEHYFPTLLRCEPTHFWGYLMTPKGKILTVGSPQPVASYAMNYDLAIWSRGDDSAVPVTDTRDGGHLIHTVSLDVLHALPLPPRHPQNLTTLKPGEERSWTIILQPAESLEKVKPVLAASLSAPMIDAARYTLAAGEPCELTLFSPQPVSVKATSPDGAVKEITASPAGDGKFSATFAPAAGPGIYSLAVTGKDGQRSEACFSVRQPWSWYLDAARKASLKHKQYASSHLEQWLGLTTGVLARRHLPDPELDAQTDLRLKEILRLQWNLEKKIPTNIPHSYREFSNTTQMAGLLAYRYMADRDPYWLDLAAGFADYTVSQQYPDGNYMDYTSVFYPAKSLMEVMAAEKLATNKAHAAPGSAFDRHYNSVKKAMDFLVRAGDNLKTEGQNTFEDGMISCSGTQLGLFALWQQDETLRRKYAESARNMLVSHRCLEQLLIPDSRMNGATIRFWESQYDVLMRKSVNMVNSPHGWSAWMIPGLWYQYLLTGDEEWLRRAMNSLGSCAQLVDSQSGELRWAFVPDPYREVTMLEPNPDNPMRGNRVERVIGEQYVPMIAAFHYPDSEPVSGNGTDSGWTCCNDVHEVFIALEEVALTAAYVVERADGTLVTWNCSAARNGDGAIRVVPAEKVVSRVHVNLKKPQAVTVKFPDTAEKTFQARGMQWIGPGGVPELLR